MASRLYYTRSDDDRNPSPLERFLILRCGDPVGWFLHKSFPTFMWLSDRFHEWLRREQLGDLDDTA